MTETLPASPEVILQTMRESVEEMVKADMWDLDPIFGLVCDTPDSVKFLALPLPLTVRQTMTPPESMDFVAFQMETSGLTPPLHPAEGWTVRGFGFMAEGYGISVSTKEEMSTIEGSIKDREDSVEMRMFTSALATGEILSVIWERGKEEPTDASVVQNISDTSSVDGRIPNALSRMAAVMA